MKFRPGATVKVPVWPKYSTEGTSDDMAPATIKLLLATSGCLPFDTVSSVDVTNSTDVCRNACVQAAIRIAKITSVATRFIIQYFLSCTPVYFWGIAAL